MITLIAATDKDGLIGNNGKLPWNIPEDMKFFKTMTTGKIVVMGRKTYISIGQPLKNRVNVIISESIKQEFDPTKDINEYNSDIIVLKDFDNVFKNDYFKQKDIFIIGGRSIYKQSLEKQIPDRLLISKIDGEFDGNEYMPEIPDCYKFTQLIRISDRVTVWEYKK